MKRFFSGHARGSAARPAIVFGLILLGILMPVAFVGWGGVFGKLLKFSGPVVEILEAPRGLGSAPVTFRARITDTQSGLQNILVRVHSLQRTQPRDLVVQELRGETEAPVVVNFPGESAGFDEGEVTVEVTAADASIWGNRTTRLLPLRVDYRRPKIITVTSQSTVREGGAYLLFYRAFDEDLALSGVKVGNSTFLGYPARGIDKELNDNNLFVSLFAVPSGTPDPTLTVRLFAEDGVGNVASANVPAKIVRRADRPATVAVSEDYLRQQVSTLAEEYFPKLQKQLGALGRKIEFSSPKGSIERLFEEFQFVERDLREANEIELLTDMRAPPFERFWEDSFEIPSGAVRFGFGQNITYVFQNRELGQRRSQGIEFDLKPGDAEVSAVNEGIVAFSRRLGVYDRVVGIDHGLGLISVYGYLDQVTVKMGERISKGQTIGLASRNWFGPGHRLLLQFRLHGVPVDPAEWFDRAWYGTQITGRVNDIRRSLKLPVYAPLR